MLNIKPYKINLLLSLLIIATGLWSYEASGRDLHTMSVPFLGIVLAFFHKQMKVENSRSIKGAMVATILIFSILILPLRNSIIANNSMAILRVGIMLVTSGLALVYYYYYFRQQSKIK